jgi:hypothetical protein
MESGNAVSLELRNSLCWLLLVRQIHVLKAPLIKLQIIFCICTPTPIFQNTFTYITLFNQASLAGEL